MKYNAGEKSLRDKDWIKIPVINALYINRARTPVVNWCKDQPSTGKYYYHYASTHWWFENEQDAIMFTLRWGEYVG